MTSYDLAHRFFHDPESRGEYAGVRSSFNYYTNSKGEVYHWAYYSYSTSIAEIKRDLKKEKCLIISDYKYSKTTAKHLNELERACPFWPNNIIFVPWVNDSTYGFNYQLKQVKGMTEKDLCQKSNRELVVKTIEMYDKYVKHFRHISAECRKMRNSAKLKKVLAITTEKDNALKERQRRLEETKEQRRIEQMRRLEERYAKADGLTKLQILYGNTWYGTSASEEMQAYRRELQSATDAQGRHLSYVWLTDNGAFTSQHCTAPMKDVVRLCKLWKRHERMLGERAGQYTVVESDLTHVKIGCHVIPAWNIELICNKLQIAA